MTTTLGHDVSVESGGKIFINDFSNEIEAIQRKVREEAAEKARRERELSAQTTEAEAEERERLRSKAEEAAKKEIEDLKVEKAKLIAEKNALKTKETNWDSEKKTLTVEKEGLIADKKALETEKTNWNSEKKTLTAKNTSLTTEVAQIPGSFWQRKVTGDNMGNLPETWNGRKVMIYHKQTLCAMDAVSESGTLYTWHFVPGNINQIFVLELEKWPYWKIKHHDKYLECCDNTDGSTIRRLTRGDKWFNWRIRLDSDLDVSFQNQESSKWLSVRDLTQNKDGPPVYATSFQNNCYWRLAMIG